MGCPKCDSDKTQKFGKTRDGQQRYRCKDCRKTFSEPKPLPGSATDIKTATMALSMLLEGMSVRATGRLTGLDKNTILRLMVKAGERVYQFMIDTLVDVPAESIQCDEQWAFVYCKSRTQWYDHHDYLTGDAYVFTAIDRDTKLLLCFHLGKRTTEDTREFSQKLARAIGGRPHVSTDGYRPYCTEIPEAFGGNVDHSMLIKQYGSPSKSAARRYSPARIIGVKTIHNAGNSEMDREACTSHIERHNLSNRMHNRRFTRLTNAFSKDWDNHEAMFSLYAAWYNFCRKHLTIKTTPAVEAGIVDEPWSLERLLTESAKHAMVA